MNYVQESSLKYVPSKYSTHVYFKWRSLECCELGSHFSVTA